jgi:hypothetical protein
LSPKQVKKSSKIAIKKKSKDFYKPLQKPLGSSNIYTGIYKKVL